MRRSYGRGCWRWDQEKEEGRGGDRRRQWPGEGGGEPWTASARADRCPGPSPSGHAVPEGTTGRPSGLQWSPRTPGSWPNSPPTPPLPLRLHGPGPSGAGQGGTPPSLRLTPNPLTYHSSLPGRQPLPTRPGGSTHASPQWPGGPGGRGWPEGADRWGELRAPKEEGARRGHLLGSA